MAPPEKSRQVKGTLKGYYLWAFDKVREGQGGPEGEEGEALHYIVGRWLDKDRVDAASEFLITRDAYRRAVGLNVTDLQTEKNKRRKAEDRPPETG